MRRDELASIAKVFGRNSQAVVLCSHHGDLPFFLSETSVRLIGTNANFSIRGDQETRYLMLYDPYPRTSIKRLAEICEMYSVDFIVWRKEQPAVVPDLDHYADILNCDHYAVYLRKGVESPLTRHEA